MPGTDDQHGGWAPVDSKIWSPVRRRKWLRRVIQRIVGTFASLLAPALIVGGPLMVLVTILGAYYLVGPGLIGPALLAVLALFFVGFVLVVEKMGYGRNFDRWDFPLSLTRLGGLVIALAIVLAVTYVTLYIWKP
jgi:hypothetical protein